MGLSEAFAGAFSPAGIAVGFLSCLFVHTASATMGIPLNLAAPLGGGETLASLAGGAGGCADSCGLAHGFNLIP